MSIETMTKLATVTVGAGGSSTIDFTNIPQTYTDLVVKASLRGTTTTTTFAIQINGSTVTSVIRLYGSGSSGATDTFNEHYIDPSNFTASTFGNTDIYIPNYTSATNKSYGIDSVGENNAAQAYMNMGVGNLTTTSPITSLTLIRTSGVFDQYSSATLYGVKAARHAIATTKPLVTGGVLTSDTNYYYRTFTSSGTLGISGGSLTADLLIIAGGGGGSYGGGGAGGVVYAPNSYFTSSTTLSVIVGAGGSPGYFRQGNNSSVGTILTAIGGGFGGDSTGGSASQNGANGGSGGGAYGSGSFTGGSGTPTQGNAGGNASGGRGAGGGGAGAAGGNESGGVAGAGGAGTSAYSSWGLATSTGENVSGTYYYAGGGAGYDARSGVPAGGYGGGGSQSNDALVNTGGGGGAPGKGGGSGLVIIRYTKSQVQ